MHVHTTKHNTLGDTNGEGFTETDSTKEIPEIPDTVDGAIDEAIKAETEKLYEEACSNVSSSGTCLGPCLSCFFYPIPGWDKILIGSLLDYQKVPIAWVVPMCCIMESTAW